MSAAEARRPEPEEALAAARRALAKRPEEPARHVKLIDLLIQHQKLGEAERAARAALSRARENPTLHALLGRVLTKSGRHAEAVEAIRDGIAAAPDNAALHAMLSHGLTRLGLADEALEAIGRAIELGPRAGFHVVHGDLLRRAGRRSEADAAYRAALALEPGHKDASARLGEAGEAATASLVAAPGPAVSTAVPAAPFEAAPVEAAAVQNLFGPPGRAVHGRDGWLFHCVDEAFHQICRPGALTDADCERLLTIWEARHAWCAERGIVYRLMIVPERHVLYPDKLPEGYAPDPARPITRLLAAADDKLRPAIIYPADAMIAARASHEVCYKTDLHWTRYGAWIGYRALLASIPGMAGEALKESALTVRERRGVGDMALWLGDRTRELSEFHEPPPADVRETFTNRTFKTGQVDVYASDAPAARGKKRGTRRLVLFRTSNSTPLLPFLHQHFVRTVGTASVGVHFDLLRSEKPDVVISEMPERYLAVPGERSGRIKLPRDFVEETFQQFTGVSLPL